MNLHILQMAEKLKYVTADHNKVNVLIDDKSVQVGEDEFLCIVHEELLAGKTLVSAIRDTVFKRIRFSGVK